MRVAELWRYPVKSLQGERVEAVRITEGGLEGDRRFAIFELDTGLGLTGRRVPELLFASARLREDGGVRIQLPNGAEADDDDALSDWLGRRVSLRRSDSLETPRYEDVLDYEHESSSAWKEFEGASGPFHDSARARVSLVSVDTIGAWDRRRFRANVLIDGAGEDGLVGHTVRIGDATLDIGTRIPRCVMVTRAQPGGLERDLSVLRTIAREREACIAVAALVSRPGAVHVGDRLTADGSLGRD